eukprot:gene10532-9438_t
MAGDAACAAQAPSLSLALASHSQGSERPAGSLTLPFAALTRGGAPPTAAGPRPWLGRPATSLPRASE